MRRLTVRAQLFLRVGQFIPASVLRQPRLFFAGSQMSNEKGLRLASWPVFGGPACPPHLSIPAL